MKLAGVTLFAAFLFAGNATAAVSQPIAWPKKNMLSAVKALGYPKPHAKKVACAGLGPADESGAYTSFRCTATYRHHHRTRFQIGGDNEGGWLCAGRTITGCKLLRHGFVTSTANGTPDLAARGYMSNRYGSYQATGFCQPAGTLRWTCGFTEATVTLAMKKVTGGYIETASG